FSVFVDTTSRAVMDIMTKTTEYLQPNPASRAKMTMINSMSKMRGQEKGLGYIQTETILGESMQKFGRELGEESNFGLALIDAGESMRELGEVKDALDMEVKQNFLDPLQTLHDKDLKEIAVRLDLFILFHILCNIETQTGVKTEARMDNSAKLASHQFIDWHFDWHLTSSLIDILK
uniref:BAR domain-containing protein n=1 Tax=Hucho hucho TaxID=62062 RepID=A0A4W5RNL7_9TELE